MIALDWRIWVSLAIGASLAAGATLAFEEYAWLRRRGELSEAVRREMRLSWSCLVPNTLASVILLGFWTTLYSQVQAWAPWRIPTTLASAAIAFLAVDLCYYWEHRAAHRVPVLWRLYHAAHHTSHHYTIATAYRVSFCNHLIAPLFYLPCVLLGFEPALVAALQLLTIHYQAWVHTRMIGSLGPIDRIVNTPANHRMHHSRAGRHQGRNYGAVLTCWDTLFGTRVPAETVSDFGVPGLEPPRTLLALHLEPWRAQPQAGSSQLQQPALNDEESR